MYVMKKNGILISLLLLISACSSAQNGNLILVPAGSKVEDCIPYKEKYRYPEFISGKVIFKNGMNTEAKLNYNFLTKEMQYLHEKDTLAIANETDILQVTIAGDTYLFDKDYLELINNGKIMVAVKQYFRLAEVQKRDSYGSAGSNSATDSYSSIQTEGRTYNLITNEDRIYHKISDFFLATSSSGFIPFTKKKVMQLFPKNRKAIDDYLKSNRVDFDSREDLIRFAKYLSGL
jgi:hypothetical protein